MLGFKEYVEKEEELLTEAKFNPASIGKVVKVIHKYFNKKFGRVYRYGGENGVQHYSNTGIGYLFIRKNGSALRLNFDKGKLETASVWKRFKIGEKADFTITFYGLNIVQILDKICDIWKKPKLEKLPMLTESVENDNIDYTQLNENDLELLEALDQLNEARRATPEEFYNLVVRTIGPNENVKSMRLSRYAEIADMHDVQVPSYVKKQKTKMAHFSCVPPENLDANKPAKSDPVYYIKVTGQDPVTKKFLSTKEDKTAQEITKQIKSSLMNHNEETAKKEIKDPNTLFGHMAGLCQLVIRNARKALLIYGGPGTGKTFTITKTLKEAGLAKNKDWYFVKGKVTTASLFEELYKHRKGKILVFDDADNIWGDQDAGNLLKAALDNSDERVISWISNRTKAVSHYTDDQKLAYNAKADEFLKGSPVQKLDAEGNPKFDKNGDPVYENSVKLPSEFQYDGRIIFISNLSYEKFDSAVLTRSAKIDMTLTRDQMFARIEGILSDLGDPDVSIEAKREVLEFLRTENSSGSLEEISMRTFVAAVELHKSGLPDWKSYLQYM